MPHMLIRHKVKDFDPWKLAFDSHQAARQQAGLRDVYLWHDAGDANTVTILFKVSDLAKARKFAASEDLRSRMKEAGVAGTPDIFYLED